MKKFTAILANGDFPRRLGSAWRLLASADRVIACDGAAENFYRHFGRRADCVIGDFDSVRFRHLARLAKEVVHDPDQNDNDLAKAINWCRRRKWCKPVVFGSGGKREDHALGNVFRAMEARLEAVSDYGRFVPFKAAKDGGFKFRARTGKGAAISFFALDRATRMKSRGLEWALDEVRFDNLYCATLNRASAEVVQVWSTGAAFAYIACS